MQGSSILKNVFTAHIETGLTNCVYHSVITRIEEGGKRFPVYSKGGEEYFDIGIDDRKYMTVYCRQIDDLRVLKNVPLGSCGRNSFFVAVPHRIVYWNDFEKRNHDDLIKIFMEFVFLPNVRLLRIINNKDKLLQLETTPKMFNLGGTSFYAAIDFEITFMVSQLNCGEEICCNGFANPFCLK